MRQQPRGRVGGVGHRRVAEHHQAPVRGVGDQPDRRAEHERRACPRCPPAPGRRRSRARAAGAPASSPTPAGRSGPARCGSVRQLARRPGARRSSSVPAGGAAVEPQPLPGAGDDVEADDVVRRAAVAQGPRAAGVVADHPADRAAVVRARVGAEPQAVRPGRRLQGGLHDARLDASPCAPRRRRRQHPVQVPAGVEDDAGADGVAGDRRARAPRGERHAEGAADLERRRRSRRRAAAGRRPAAGTRYSEASEEYSARASPESSTSPTPARRNASVSSRPCSPPAGTVRDGAAVMERVWLPRARGRSTGGRWVPCSPVWTSGTPPTGPCRPG